MENQHVRNSVAGSIAADKIELLGVDLLQRNRLRAADLRSFAASLRLDFGWHYLLDINWILEQLGTVSGCRIMDAGAGTGVIQWYLAQQGAQVVSVDRGSRALLPSRFRRRFNVLGLRPQDLRPQGQVFSEILRRPQGAGQKAGALRRELLGLWGGSASPGSVAIYNQDLAHLVDIPDNSLDAVVAVSALEHNSQEDLPGVVAELMRVLKPGGTLLASLNAARDQDWWHEPSKGWCYTEPSLRRLFSLPMHAPSNYAHYDELFADLVGCAELRDNLAAFYFRSGENGMPWGRWDPQYLPVGVCKVKQYS